MFKSDLTKWSVTELVDLLAESGYNSDDIISAEYYSMNCSGEAVFKIKYEDLEGEIGEGKVYVGLKVGKLTAEF